MKFGKGADHITHTHYVCYYSSYLESWQQWESLRLHPTNSIHIARVLK